MILAHFPEGSCLTAPDRDCKLPLFCLERQSFLHLQDMWMTLTEAEGMMRLCFFLTVTWAEELSSSLRDKGLCCLSESLGFLTCGWTLCMVQVP